MPVIAWVLVFYFTLTAAVSLGSMIAKSAKEAKSALDGAATVISILLTMALYGWLIWVIVQLGTS